MDFLDTYHLLQNVIKGNGYIPKIPYEKEAFQKSNTINPLPRRNCLYKPSTYSSLWEFFYSFQSIPQNNIHNMMILEKGNVIFEQYVSPYSKTYRHTSYSMCKSVVSMAIGLAYDDKKISLNTKVGDIIPLPKNTHKSLHQLTIYHLLTMQAGVEFHEMSQAFSIDCWQDYFRSHRRFLPGEDFYYNSMNSYILCVIITKLYNKSVLELLNERIFSAMGITDITWDTCPKGIEKGGFGMKLSLEDMAKLGQLWLQKGRWKDIRKGEYRQIVSKEYVSLSTSIQVKRQPNGHDYGLHIWIIKDGYLFNGMLGQNIFIYPEKETIVATQGGVECFLPTNEMINKVHDFVFTPKELSIKILCKQIAKKVHLTSNKVPAKTINQFTQMQDKKYQFQNSIFGIVPYAMQLVYQIEHQNIVGISFDKLLYDNHKPGICVLFQYMNTNISVCFGILKAREQLLTINGQQYPVAAVANVTENEDGTTVVLLKIHFLEEANTRIYKLFMLENQIRIHALEKPSLSYLYHNIFMEKKLIPVKSIEKYADKKYIAYRIDNFLNPFTYGFEIF